MLFSDGMFMDGVIYATIARNLALGDGSFWHLFYSETGLNPFHEHPPLAMGLQSIFFSIFGDSIYVERSYSLMTFIVTGFLIVQIWRQIAPKKLAWLPLLFWVVTPLIPWSCGNNMLENTMMIFTTSATLLYLIQLKLEKPMLTVLSGLMIFLAFLTKGPVGLFPLAFPFWMFIFDKKVQFNSFIKDTFLMLLGLLTPFAVIFGYFPDAADSLVGYFNKQVLGSVSHIVTVESRFFILGRLFSQMIPSLIILILFYVFSRKMKSAHTKMKWGIIIFALAMSGIVPIMISLKQRGFYMLASLPLMSIAIAFFIAPKVKILFDKIDTQSTAFRNFRIISFLCLVGSLVYVYDQSLIIERDKDQVTDIYKISSIIPEKSILSSPSYFDNNYSLQAYLYRYGKISLESKNVHSYFLTKKGLTSNVPIHFHKHPIKLKLYDLYVEK